MLPPLEPDDESCGGNGDSLPLDPPAESWGGNGDSCPPLELLGEPELGDPPPELPEEPELGDPPPGDELGDSDPDGELVDDEDVVKQPASADAATTGHSTRNPE